MLTSLPELGQPGRASGVASSATSRARRGSRQVARDDPAEPVGVAGADEQRRRAEQHLAGGGPGQVHAEERAGRDRAPGRCSSGRGPRARAAGAGRRRGRGRSRGSRIGAGGHRQPIRPRAGAEDGAAGASPSRARARPRSGRRRGSSARTPQPVTIARRPRARSAAIARGDGAEVDDAGVGRVQGGDARARAARSPRSRSAPIRRRPGTPFALPAPLELVEARQLALRRPRRSPCRDAAPGSRAPRSTRTARARPRRRAAPSASRARSRCRRG